MAEAQQFLDAVYEELDFEHGDLISGDLPCSDDAWTDDAWTEKGDWAELTRHGGAQKIFFVRGNPVVVFAKQDSEDPEELRQLFRSVW